MHDVHLPNLTFPDVKLGIYQTPWDLRPLIYKGGAKTRVDKVASMIDAGKLGAPLVERIALVERVHEEIHAVLTGGGSKASAISSIERLRAFFGWVDSSGHSLNLDTVASVYVHWSDHLLHRIRIIKDVSEQSAYESALKVSRVLDKVLERGSPIIKITRLTRPPQRKRARGVEADKQNLEQTFAFGRLLLDILDGLPLDKLWGPLPVRIQLRTGQDLVEWSRLRPPEDLRRTNPQNTKQRYQAKVTALNRADWENDRTLRTRAPLINLRIEAELLFFIVQTGMNLAQAHQLKFRHYSYASTIDGYIVRDFKHRRKGEVLFEIFSEYKAIFERYLAWRKAVFPDDPDGLLFPLVRRGRTEDTVPSFDRIRKTCKKLGLRFIPPSQLRKTRVNWLLRRSSDPNLAAEQAQHTRQTLIRVYEEPSLQRTMTEVVRYWQASDPSIAPPAPGVCTGLPMPAADIPPEATQPDCIRPSGCLWCEHHRDVDNLDYVWSITSFRHLKSLELARYHPPQPGKAKLPTHPALFAIERLSDKLHWFQQSNAMRRGWVEESLALVEEGNYHPAWCDLISAEEGVL